MFFSRIRVFCEEIDREARGLEGKFRPFQTTLGPDPRIMRISSC